MSDEENVFSIGSRANRAFWEEQENVRKERVADFHQASQRRVALDPSIAIGPPRPQPGFVDTLREPAVACALVIVCLSLLVMVFNHELAGLYVWFVTR